jgi:hypothetical protein
MTGEKMCASVSSICLECEEEVKKSRSNFAAVSPQVRNPLLRYQPAIKITAVRSAS